MPPSATLEQVLAELRNVSADVAALRQAIAGGEGVPGLAEVVKGLDSRTRALEEGRWRDKGFAAALAMFAAYFSRYLPK